MQLIDASREKYDVGLRRTSGVRYVTSDPIGLGGGLNTFGYVYQNPVVLFDEDGLRGRGNGRTVEQIIRAMYPRMGTPYVPPRAPIDTSPVLGPIPGVNTPVPGPETDEPEQCSDDCSDLIRRINIVKNGIARRFRQLSENKGGIDQRTHWEQLRGRQKNLRKLLNQAEAKGCPIPPDAWYWATR